MSCRLAPEQERTPLELVETVEERCRQLEELLVVRHERQAAKNHVETPSLRRVVAVVFEVRLVDDSSDLPQHRIVQLEAPEERLEAAVAAVVRELDPAHVEWRRILRQFGRIVDEHERRLGVDEAADQPGARSAVDVALRPRRPPHDETSTTEASCSTA